MKVLIVVHSKNKDVKNLSLHVPFKRFRGPETSAKEYVAQQNLKIIDPGDRLTLMGWDSRVELSDREDVIGILKIFLRFVSGLTSSTSTRPTAVMWCRSHLNQMKALMAGIEQGTPDQVKSSLKQFFKLVDESHLGTSVTLKNLIAEGPDKVYASYFGGN